MGIESGGQSSIRSWFIPRKVPNGEAPDAIRQQWIGVPLPVRYERPIEGFSPIAGQTIFSREQVYREDAIKIRTEDAVKALALLGRTEASNWWAQLREIGVVASNLIFEMACGEWLPNEYVYRSFPQVEGFDSLA